MAVADVGLDGEIDRCWVEVLRARGTTDSIRMHLAGVRRDCIRGIRGSLRKAPANLFRKRSDVFGIALRTSFGLNLPAAFAHFRIIETLLFGARERFFRDQDALSFIALSRAAESKNNRAQRRVLRCAPRDASISP